MTVIVRLHAAAGVDLAGQRCVALGDAVAVTDADRGSAVEIGSAEGPAPAAGLTDLLLEVLTVAEVAFALVAAGMLLSAMWLAAPRTILLAVAGGASLAVGVLGLARLPVSEAGILLLVLAGASLIMEIVAAPGLVLHAVGGGVALAMGGACLYQPWTGAHPGLVIPVSVAVAAGTWLAGRRSWRVTRDDPFSVSDELVGRLATVLDADGDHGHAVVAGHIWVIRSSDRPLTAGARVRVVSLQDGGLIVKPSRIPPL